MLITHYIQDSFSEYEGEHALVLFTKGCNLDCTYCYNKDKGTDQDAIRLIDELVTPLHTAIVLCGGEPSIHYDLFEVLSYAKSKNLKTKVFTNGIKSDIIMGCSAFYVLDACSIDFKECENVKEVLRYDIEDDEYVSGIIYLATFLKIFDFDVEFRTTEYVDGVYERTHKHVENTGIRHIKQQVIEV